MKKISKLLLSCTILLNTTLPLNAAAIDQTAYTIEEENLDLQEEIEMFEDFYEHPDLYIFQDQDGNDLNTYILDNQSRFESSQYDTTYEFMQRVRSVLDLSKVIESRDGQTKTWTNQKVYYTTSKYVLYDFSATISKF